MIDKSSAQTLNHRFPSIPNRHAMGRLDDEDDDSEASHTSEEQLESSQTVDSGNNRDKKQPAGKKTLAKFKKAPQAPRRFKSAFIFFSSAKHKEIRAQLADSGVAVKVIWTLLNELLAFVMLFLIIHIFRRPDDLRR